MGPDGLYSQDQPRNIGFDVSLEGPVMSIQNFTKISGSTLQGHQRVEINDQPAGEVWREQVIVPDRTQRLTRHPKKWRWFARTHNDPTTLGRGTRSSLLFGSGFTTRQKAVDAIEAALAAQREGRTAPTSAPI